MLKISVSLRRGGSGKSTTVEALSVNLAEKGSRVLVLDSDPQANSTFIMGADPRHKGIYDVVTGKSNVVSAIQTLTQQIDLISPGIGLDNLEHEFFKKSGREKLFARALSPISSDYDYCIIDTAPALNLAVLNALTASDYVLIPMGADVQSLQGLSAFNGFVEDIRTFYNGKLRIAGILVTKFEGRTNAGQTFDEIIRSQAGKLGIRVFNTRIRKSSALQLAQGEQNISIFTRKNNASDDYCAFTDELLSVIGKEN